MFPLTDESCLDLCHVSEKSKIATGKMDREGKINNCDNEKSVDLSEISFSIKFDGYCNTILKDDVVRTFNIRKPG